MPAFLLGVLALVHLAPEMVAWATETSQAAWGYVAHGVEAAVIWAALAAYGGQRIAAVCMLGVWEGVQRGACRLAFPMVSAPPRPPPGQNLCDVATGLPLSWVSIVAIALVAAVIAEGHRRGV